MSNIVKGRGYAPLFDCKKSDANRFDDIKTENL